MTKSALIVVDVQNDFCEGGALPAADTNSLIQPLHRYIEAARRHGTTIVFTQDWYPVEHSSLESNDGPWPVHCVAGSKGAATTLDGDIIIHKGVEPHGPGYSGFESTELAEQLRRLHVKRVLVTGVAADYCVRATHGRHQLAQKMRITTLPRRSERCAGLPFNSRGKFSAN